MRLRYDDATDSVVVDDGSDKRSLPLKSDINPQPDVITGGRYFYDEEIGVYQPGGNYPDPTKTNTEGPQIIRDIEGYRTAAGDIASDGKRIYISSRSRHREFLKDNRLVEVGNDYDRRQVDDRQPRRESKATFLENQRKRVEAIKQAVDLVRTGRVAEHFDVRRD